MFKTRQVLGLDLGTSAIKAILLKETKGEVEVVQAGIVELNLDPALENNKKKSRVSEALKRVLSENNIRTKSVVSVVPGQSTIIRHLKLPPGTRDRLSQVIKYEAQNQIPFPLDKVILDYQAFPGKEGEEVKTILVAMKKELIDEHLDIIEEAGLRCEAIDVSSLALYNGLKFGATLSERETVAFINIGATTTDISICREGVLEFTRSIPVAGNDLTEVIQTKIGIPFSEAEKLKRKEADALPQAPSPVTEAISPILENLFTEIRRSLNYYRTQLEGTEVNRILLSGGSAGLRNLDGFLAKGLTIPVEIANPLAKIKFDPQTFRLKEIAPSLSIAIGLALHALGLGEIRVNLLPRVVREREAIQTRKRKLLVAAALGVVAIILSGLLFLQRLKAEEARLNFVEGELKKIAGIVPQVERLKKEKAAVEKRMKVIEGLLLGRARWLDLLLEMTKTIPSRVWFKSVSLPDKDQVSISAQALSVADISLLMERLKASPRFEEVSLGSVSTEPGKPATFPMSWKIKRAQRLKEKEGPEKAQGIKMKVGEGLRKILKEEKEELERLEE